MTNPREQVKRALWYLEREPMPLRDPADEGARRHRIALAVDARVRALTDEKRTHSRRRKVVALACAAAMALSFGALWLRVGPRASAEASGSPVLELDVQGPASVVRGGQNLPVGGTAATRISPADELRTTADAHARAVLANGAVVDVDPSTSLRFDANRDAAKGFEELGLDRGTIALKVPKLGPHRRLSIRTPDATVTVRGTEFRVDVREHDGHSATGVKVVEGSVWVTSNGREITLEKGSEWSSDSGSVEAVRAASSDAPSHESAPVPARAAPEAAAAAPNAAAVASARPGAAPANGPSSTPSVHDEARSTLGAENDQYQRGVGAARAGDDRKALAAFETFLARYPASPLAQSAEVERFRALKRLGRIEEASRRARRYLAAYPVGFARAEAQSVAVESLSSTSGP